MRLDKFLAERGLGTRSEIKALLSKGLVTVNGKVVKEAKYQLADFELEQVVYQATNLSPYSKQVFMLYKPVGVLSAAKDDKSPCALDYLPSNLQTRKYSCVGRLDKYSEGLLLLTNDGELIHRLTQPKWQIKKTYKVTFSPELKAGEAELITSQFANGLEMKDLICKPATFQALSANTALVTVSEGKFHQVRRMMAHFAHEVTSLIRLCEGPIELGNLQTGEIRPLNAAEYAKLYAEVALERN